MKYAGKQSLVEGDKFVFPFERIANKHQARIR